MVKYGQVMSLSLTLSFKKEESGLGLSSNSSDNGSETVPYVKARRIELFYLINFYVFKNFSGTLRIKICIQLSLAREVETILIVSSVGLML